MTDRAPRVRFLLPVIILAMVGFQGWFGRALALGQFGPTPAAAVVLPVIVWLALGAAVIVTGVLSEVRGRGGIRSAAVSFFFCSGGLWLAWDTLQGWLEVA